MILRDYSPDAKRVEVNDASTTQILCDGVDVARDLFDRGILVDGSERFKTFLEAFASQIAELVGGTVAFVAEYDATVDSTRRVTVVPRGVGYKRAGRALLECRVELDVVIARRSSDFAGEMEFAREVAFWLADRDVIVGGAKYFVDEIDATNDAEQLESNVCTNVISITYKGTGAV